MKYVDVFIEETAVSEDEKEVLRFGFERMKLMIISFVMVLITGYMFHVLIKTLIFIVCLMPLRQNAGGYHMKSKWTCAVISFLCLTGCIVIIKNISLDIHVAVVLVAISTVLICILSPIGNANHLLDEMEKTVYGRRARLICIMEGVVFFVLLVNNLIEWCMLIVLSEIITSLLLVIGAVQEKMKKRGEKGCIK